VCSVNDLIGKNVRAARQSHGLSREQFCNLTGISVGILDAVETVGTKVSAEQIKSFSQALGVPVEVLISDGNMAKLKSSAPLTDFDHRVFNAITDDLLHDLQFLKPDELLAIAELTKSIADCRRGRKCSPAVTD